MDILGSSEIRGLYDDLLILRNRVAKIKEYYTTVTTELTDSINGVNTTIEEDIAWMDAQLTKLNLLYSELSTSVNNFVAKSTGDLIESHVEYQYMINLYKSYMKDFYTRMTATEITLETEFLQDTDSISNSSIWDFKYTKDPLNTNPINLYIESFNWTPSTRFVEVSNNRYFASNKDGMFLDVNYNTHSCECYIIKSLYHNNRKDAIYRISDIVFDELTDALLIVYAERTAGSSSETIYVASFNISTGKPITTFTAATIQNIGQSYVFIGLDSTTIYIRSRNYIYGINRTTLSIRSVMTPNTIVGAAIFGNNLYYTTSSTSIAVIDKSSFASIRNYSTSLAPLISGDTGVIVGLHATNTRLYIVTVLSVYSSVDGCVTVVRETRVDGIGVPLLSFSDTNKYAIDKQDTIYYLYNKNFIYAVSSVGTVVMSPTKLSDKVLTMDNETHSNTAGYAINEDTSLFNNIGSNSDFSIYWNNKLIVGSFTGRAIASCDILTGYWTKEDGTPLISGKVGPSIYANSNIFGVGRISATYLDADTLYVGTDIGEVFSCNLNTNTWIVINAGNIIGTNPVYAFAINKGILIVAGQLGRVGSYDIINNVTYNYDGEEGIHNTGTITGGYAIRTMVVYGAYLIAAGVGGRVCSMSFNDNKWTRFNGTPDNVSDIAISSIIYNDGTAFLNATIEKLVVYVNIIIAAGYSGRVASVYIGTNYWTKYTGADQVTGNVGPGIFNASTAIGIENIKDMLIINRTLIIAGYKGYIASYNFNTYGWTRYDGIDIDENKSGPGVYYDGMSISSKNILSISYDEIRGNLIFTGELCVAGTMNLALVEIYTDTISKLYYIGKKTGITNDFDSTLIEFSKSNFIEKKVCRPPREFNTDPYVEMYNGNYWVYKNNGYVYRITSDLKTIHRSMDTGVNYAEFPIVNSLGLIDTDIVSKIIGHVTNTGVFILHVIVNDTHKLIIGDVVNGTFICKSFNIDSIDDVVFQQVADTSTNDSYVIMVKKNNIFKFLSYDLVAETISFKQTVSINYNFDTLADATTFKEFQYSQDMMIGIALDNVTLYANTFNNINELITLDVSNDYTIYNNMNTARYSASAVVLNNKIYVMGGWTGTVSLNTCEVYDPSTNTWTNIANMNTARRSHSAVVLNNKIYVIGGSDNNGTNKLNTCEVFDPLTNIWTQNITTCANTNTTRSSHLAVVLNNKIYVMGGIDNNGAISSCEVYDPLTNIWTQNIATCANMNTARHSSSAVVLNNKIYVMGGHDETANLATCEVYDPLTNIWTQNIATCANMNTTRSSASAVVLNNKIYVIDGNSNYVDLNTCEVYDPLTNIWTQNIATCANMNTARAYHASVVLNNKIYVMGGWNLNTCEIYDNINNKWSLSNTKIINPANNKLLHTISGISLSANSSIFHVEKIVLNNIKYLMIFGISSTTNVITMYIYKFIDTFTVSSVYSKSLSVTDYIKDSALSTYSTAIVCTKLYEYMYKKERQLIIGLNVTIPETIPIYKHVVLTIDIDSIGAIETAFNCASSITGIASLISVDYKDKHVIIALNTTSTTGYKDYLIRYDIVDSDFIRSLNSIKDIWLSQKLTSSYMVGVNGKNAAAIISKSRDKTHTQELLENIVNDQDVLLYHPDFGMIFLNSENGGYIARQDKDTGLPQFSSKIKALDGFKGNIADVISPILERNTALASGNSEVNRNTANIMSTMFFRHAPVGTVLVNQSADANKQCKVMVRPNSTVGTLKEREYYIAKINSENGGVSGIMANDAASIKSLAVLNNKITLPVNLNSTMFADVIVSKDEFDSSDPSRFVENISDTLLTPTIDKTPFYYSDLYVKLYRGYGYGVMTVDGVYAKTVSGLRRFIPYFKNRYNIAYELDSDGSTITTKRCDVKSLINGYSLFSSYISVVGDRGVLPVADMYIDISNNKLYFKDGVVCGGVKTQEFVSTPFNSIRLTQEIEKEYNSDIINTPFVIKTQAIDKLIDRKNKFAYDRIDSFSLIAEPYKYIPLYWAPALISSYLEGNDSLLSLSSSTPSGIKALVGCVGNNNQ